MSYSNLPRTSFDTLISARVCFCSKCLISARWKLRTLDVHKKRSSRFMEPYGTLPSQTHAPSSTYTHTLHRGFWLRVGDRASAGFSLGNSAAILQPQSFMPLVAILYQHFSHGCVRNVERVIMLSGSSGHLTNEILISPACLALGRSQDTNICLKYCMQSAI